MAPLRLWIGFAASGLLMFLALAISPVRHVFPEWRKVQDDYNRLAAERYKMGQNVRPVEPGLRQLWNPDLGVVDRCTTCHLGIDNPELRDAPEPFRAHPTTPHRLEEIGCTVCHRGQGRATTTKAAHGATKHWESPMLPSYYVSGSCGSCHRDREPPEAYTVAAGRRLIEQANCAACHKIPGFSLQRKPGPALDGLGDKVRPEWLYRWLKSPFDYLPESKMPDFRLSAEEAAVLTSYLLTFKTKTSAQSADPRLEEALLNPSDEEIEFGETRYRELRCVSCHAQEGRGGKLGPDLGKIASKVKPLWLLSWLENPRKHYPDSIMPQYGLTEREKRSIVAYMMSELVDYDSDPDEEEKILAMIPEPDNAVMAKGEELFRQYGCAYCHSLTGQEVQGEFGADLSEIGVKDVDQLDFGSADIERSLVQWLYTKMKSPRIFSPGLRMPDYHFSDEQARQVTAALLSLTGDSIPAKYLPPAPPPLAYSPAGPFNRILEKYQCLSCHSIRGVGGTIAPDLTREGSMAKPEWIAKYFELPYTLRPIMTERMPILGLTREEAQIVIDYFQLVLVDDSIPKDIFSSPPDRSVLETGRKLFFDKYGCQACHQVGQKGGYVGPPLDGVGERLYSGYIYEWLLDPQRFLPETIHPNHGLTPEEARALTAFLYSLPPAGGSTEGSR